MASPPDNAPGVEAGFSSAGPAISASANPSASAATPGSQGPKCNDPAHLEIFKRLMKLYTNSSANDNRAESMMASEEPPDKHEAHSVMDMVTQSHAALRDICLIKKCNPELEMIEAPSYAHSSQSDSSEDEESCTTSPDDEDDEQSERGCDEHDSRAGSTQNRSSESNGVEHQAADQQRLLAVTLHLFPKRRLHSRTRNADS